MDRGHCCRWRSELIYRKFEPLLRKITSRYYRFYKWKISSYEDLYQTAAYLMLYALENYDETRGSLAKHIKRTVELKLNSMLKGEMAPRCGDRPFTFLRHDTMELYDEPRG